MGFQQPIERQIDVRKVDEIRKTSSGNSYLVCESDLGTVAFWGEEGAMANINVIASTTAPFRVLCGCIDSNWDRHAYWIPQNAKVEILDDES